MSNSDDLKKTVQEQEQAADKVTIEQAAKETATNIGNSIETSIGNIAGEVEGGIKSLQQNFDKFQDKLNTVTVEGLIDDGVESLENMATDFVNEQIANLASKIGLGSNVSVTFSEPDSNGFVFPVASSLDEEGGVEGTVAAILQSITGLGVGPGSLQKMITEASPQGLLATGKDLLEGKIGALSAEGIQGAIEQTVNSVLAEFEQTVTDGINNGLIGSINKTVNNITGYDTDGSGNLVILRDSATTGNMPDALTEFNTAIQKVKDKPFSDIQSIVTEAKEIKQNLEGAKSDFENLTGKNGDEVLRSVQENSSSRAKYNRITDESRTLIKTRNANGSDLGIVQSLSTRTLTDIRAQIIKFAGGAVSDQNVTSIINGSQGSSAEFNDAVLLLERISKKSYNEVRNFLKTIDTTITSATRVPPDTDVFPDPYVIGKYEKQWRKGKGDPDFPYVSSVEELQAELRNAGREITEFVVHWTETPTNKNIGSEEINKIHLEAGLEGIGYHYVIRRDGSLQRGRPIKLDGQHSTVNNHNSRSIGIVFVGGINVPSGTPNIQDFVSVQSLTRSQLNTFDHFARAFFDVWPGGQALGHNDIDLSEEDPGFDVRNYAEATFGKKSKFTSPSTQSPFTASEINS